MRLLDLSEFSLCVGGEGLDDSITLAYDPASYAIDRPFALVASDRLGFEECTFDSDMVIAAKK